MFIERTNWNFRLTQEEKIQLVMEIAEMLRTIDNMREDLKTYNALEKEKIKDLEMKMREKLCTLTVGEEERPANLRVEFDRPQAGQKEIYDNDTGVLLAVRDMTDDDRQDLFVNAETQEPLKGGEE